MSEEDILDSLSRIMPGDHVCFIYQTEEEHRALLAPYLSLGLERGEKILYIADARTAGEVLGYLRAEGIDVDPFLNSGQLDLLTVDDAYMREGVFDPDGMIELLTQETEKALSEGYSALRVTGEMSWTLRGLPGSERLMEYESKLNRFFPGSRCLAICQYDRRRFSPEVLLNVLTTHPVAVVGTEVYDNFYYLSPEEFVVDDLPRARLEHWVNNLASRRRSDMELRGSAERYRELFEESPVAVVIEDLSKVKDRIDGLRAEGVDDLRAYLDEHPEEERELYARMRVKDVNSRTIEIYKAPNKAGLLENLDEVFTEEALYSFKERVLAFASGETTFEDDAVNLVLTGEELRIHFKASISPGYEETWSRVLVSIADITERVEAEEALRRSEAKYRALLATSPDAIVISDLEGGITYVSPQALALFGWQDERELLGKSAFEFIAPEEHEKAMASLLDTLAEGKSQEIEYTIAKKDGSKIKAALKASLIKDTAGDPIGFMAILRDITERKRIEEQLRFQARMLDSVGQAVITTDAHGTVIYWNRPAEELYGWTAQEAKGQKIMELNPSQASREEVAEIMERLRAGGRWSGEFEVMRRDGSTFMAFVTNAPIFDENGDFVGVIGVSTDLTERLRMEEELKRINRELDAYTYIVSHDLRSPISVVISASKTLKRLIEENVNGQATGDIEKITGIIAKGADNAEQLIDNLLALARAGQESKQVQDVDVEKLIKRILIEKSDVISHKGIRIKADGDMGVIQADPTHLYQLFSNLIGNAVEHNDSPEPEIEIVYGGREKGGHRFLVCDNGSGIREKEADKLFYPFYHGKGGGTGIGLAIVRKIVDIYGGDIRAYNDNGACFDFYIKEKGYNKQ